MNLPLSLRVMPETNNINPQISDPPSKPWLQSLTIQVLGLQTVIIVLMALGVWRGWSGYLHDVLYKIVVDGAAYAAIAAFALLAAGLKGRWRAGGLR